MEDRDPADPPLANELIQNVVKDTVEATRRELNETRVVLKIRLGPAKFDLLTQIIQVGFIKTGHFNISEKPQAHFHKSQDLGLLILVKPNQNTA